MVTTTTLNSRPDVHKNTECALRVTCGCGDNVDVDADADADADGDANSSRGRGPFLDSRSGNSLPVLF